MCVDEKPALVKNALVKYFEAEVAQLAEEPAQMQVIEEEMPGSCDEVKAAGGCAMVTKECCATCGDVVQSRAFFVVCWAFCSWFSMKTSFDCSVCNNIPGRRLEEGLFN